MGLVRAPWGADATHVRAAWRRRLGGEDGFTVIEVMVAASILITGLLGTVVMLDHAESSTWSTKAREGATALQREIIESARSVNYDQVTPNTLGPALRNRGALADSSGDPGWTVRRRNFTYTVSVGVCSVDDPRDGTGDHAAGQFCAGGAGSTTAQQCRDLLGVTGIVSAGAAAAASSVTLGDCGVDVNADGQVDGLVDLAGSVCVGACATGGVDTNPADYKRVVTLVTWDKGQGNRWSLQATTIANPGLSAAPSLNALTTATALPITNAAVTTVPFTATGAVVPASYAWYLDGTARGVAAGVSTTWTFSWPLGTVNGGSAPNADEVLDGSYLVGARAFDAYGQPGAMRTITVVLNRSSPYPPQQAAGGRSGTLVNLEWAPSNERDVAGYRVYRSTDGTTWAQACALTTKTACQDTTPPAGVLLYQVVAVDRDGSGNLREGRRTASINVPASGANTRPNPPTNLAAATSSGNTIVVWKAPLIPDPDPGDSIHHYVIYRDGVAFADRFDRTQTGAQLTFTDTRTNGQQHSYWVSAVDTHLAESTLTGPVTK